MPGIEVAGFSNICSTQKESDFKNQLKQIGYYKHSLLEGNIFPRCPQPLSQAWTWLIVHIQRHIESCPLFRVGKILIQTSRETGEPELYYLRLPKDIKDYHVILMDATVATGAAAMMAIRVLLDHDVPEVGLGFCDIFLITKSS